MRLVYSAAALADLDEILTYIVLYYPAVLPAFELRLRAVTARIAAWPDSALEVLERPGVRVVPLIRYPYRVFYRVAQDHIEILHIHHSARETG